MRDGTVRFNPGVLNPDIVRPAGPIDPDVGIVFLKETGKASPLAAIVNFALHLDTVGGTLYVADYPYYVEQSLREKYGDKFVLLFGTGTCGDINHIDVTKKDRLKTDFIGGALGDTVGLEVQVFRLSRDVAVVGLPGDVFVDLGLAIKQASPFATTLVIELCQDAPGYIPTEKTFAEGSYETVNSRIAPGGGEVMVGTAVRLLKELAQS